MNARRRPGGRDTLYWDRRCQRPRSGRAQGAPEDSGDDRVDGDVGDQAAVQADKVTAVIKFLGGKYRVDPALADRRVEILSGPISSPRSASAT